MMKKKEGEWGVFMKRKRGHGCFGVCVFVEGHGGNQTTVLHCSMLVLPMPTLTWTLSIPPLSSLTSFQLLFLY